MGFQHTDLAVCEQNKGDDPSLIRMIGREAKLQRSLRTLANLEDLIEDLDLIGKWLVSSLLLIRAYSNFRSETGVKLECDQKRTIWQSIQIQKGAVCRRKAHGDLELCK